MTIEELKARMPSIDVTEWLQHPNGNGWKHKTAVIADDIKLPSDSFIGYGASIGDGAFIGLCASIGDRAFIGSRASIGDGAFIGPCASIGDGASIGDRAFIGLCASIGDGAFIGLCASIGDGAFIGSRAFIGDRASIGSRASVGPCASIGPGASVGSRAFIGSRASVGPCASVGDNASIGDDEKTILCIQASAHQITVCVPSDKVQIGCHRHPIAYWLEHFKAIGRVEEYSDSQVEEYGILLSAVDSWIKLRAVEAKQVAA